MIRTRYSEKITGLIWQAIEKLFNVVAEVEPTPNATLQLFIELMSKKEDPSVLETGTKRSMPDRSTLHKEWVPQAGEYIGTDFQTYPLHAYPYDYWRFSTEALQTLFCEKIGFKTLHSSYEFPAHIFSTRVPSTKHDPSYLNVLLLAKKIKHPAGHIEWAP